MKTLSTLLLMLVLGLVACAPTTRTVRPSTPLTTASAATAVAAVNSSPVPAFTGKPPQTNAAGLQPPERREELTRLSTLLQFNVTTSWNGTTLGKIADFIINTCETYIIYFKVDPAPDLKVAAGSQLVIPFEVVTINSGVLQADTQAIALHLMPDQLAGAPAFANLALLPNAWEEPVRAYWLQMARVSPLTSECKAISGTVYKIAYATQLIGAELKDGNHNLLGKVVDVILEPESGKLGFYVVALPDTSLVLVPIGKTNIPKEALVPGQTIELVLLTENSVLLGAPRLAANEQATNVQIQSTARGYWR